MADQLLSQADVDALVLSLTRSEPASEPLPAKPAADTGLHQSSMPINKAPSITIKPSSVSFKDPMAANNSVQPTTKPVQTANKPMQPNNKPLQPTNITRNSVPNSNNRNSININQAQKPEVSQETVNALNTKISRLTEQLTQVETNIKRLENIEKKVIDMETRLEQYKQSPTLLPRIASMSDELRKISVNLKGTPGYGVRHNFTCEKCNDHGHVAQMFRCTKCGHERWYGWWPEK
jgi:hypothetical protein